MELTEDRVRVIVAEMLEPKHEENRENFKRIFSRLDKMEGMGMAFGMLVALSTIGIFIIEFVKAVKGR